VSLRGPLLVPNAEAGMTDEAVTETLVRVNYSETDQMGVAYHARYLVWLDVARTEHLRNRGASYRELEAAGLRLVVSEAAIRYRQAARFDDLVRIRCWVRNLASRRVEFGYAVERAEDGQLLATAVVALIALDATLNVTRLPPDVLRVLEAVPDPVKLGFTSESLRAQSDFA
jgi:acyl-CoA thioester hydrolase